MDAATRQIVIASAGPIFAEKGRFAQGYYDRLFEISPEARALFRDDMAHQRRMLMAALAMVVGVLGNPERFAATAMQLGRVHARHGVTAQHMLKGQRAFDRALRDFFGADCTPDIRTAWGLAYTELSALMLLHAAADVAPER